MRCGDFLSTSSSSSYAFSANSYLPTRIAVFAKIKFASYSFSGERFSMHEQVIGGENDDFE